MPPLSDTTAFVKQAARDAGFQLAGIAPVRDFPELDRFADWIDAGHAGEMEYMKARHETGKLKRASLRSTIPWARSVIVCAISYNTAEPLSTQVNDSQRGWISRYAWGQEDYHNAVMKRLRLVESALNQRCVDSRRQTTAKHFAAGDSLPADQFQTHCYVDTGPVVERIYAKYAGVGWIGKNTCVLNQKIGSWLFLGVIVTSLELEADLPVADRCGSCTRCIDACPTEALIAPYQLDSNKCISYLTIEKRGTIPVEMRGAMGRHVFGCDICQDVCPWNRRASAGTAAEFQPRDGLVSPALDWLADMSAEEFQHTFRGSPVRRAKRSGLRRNAVIATGNSGDRRFKPVLDRLTNDEDPVVAEHARWALERLSPT